MKINLTQNLRPWACLQGGAALTLLAFLAGCGGGGSTGGIGSGIGAGNPTPAPTPVATPTSTPVPASAGGGEIVFSLRGALSRVNLDGSNLTRIPTLPAGPAGGPPDLSGAGGFLTPGAPAWFPGRQELIYGYTGTSRGGAQTSVRRVNRDGSNDREIISFEVAGYADDFEVSPDGSRIAFTRIGGLTKVAVANADGTNLVQITEGFQPSWSPDCRCIVFSRLSNSQYDIYVMNADGSNERRLTTSPDMLETYAQFSPDGRRIVYTSAQRGGQGAIYVMNADGSNPTRLTNNEGASTSRDFEPEWTSDGSRIVFLSNRNGGEDATFFIMNADGSNQRQLFSTPIQADEYDLR